MTTICDKDDNDKKSRRLRFESRDAQRPTPGFRSHKSVLKDKTMRLQFSAACLTAAAAESSARPPGRDGRNNANLRSDTRRKRTTRELDSIFDDNRLQIEIFDSGVVFDPVPINATATNSTATNATTTEETATSTPTSRAPSTSKPSTSQPTSSKPSSSVPTSQKPSTTSPTSQTTPSSKPSSRRPSTSMPTSPRPSTSKPISPKPSTSKPSSRRPSTSKPISRRPSTSKPSSRRPSRRPTSRPTQKPVSETQPSSRLKLYWESGYTWQGTDYDLFYCMECSSSGDCNLGDEIIMKRCSSSASDQKFTAVGLTIRPTNHLSWCFTIMGYGTAEDFDGVTIYTPIELQSCTENNSNQQFVGYQYGDKFELSPIDRPERCLGSYHHPKSYEKIYPKYCTTARRDTTNYWIAY